MIPELAVLLVGTGLAAALNYYVNRAPGSTPEDFAVGPEELDLSCDCCLGPLIIPLIVVAVYATSSTSFENRWVIYLLGATAFFVVLVAGVLGRYRRRREWAEMASLLERVIPTEYAALGGNTTTYRLDIGDDENNDEEDSGDWI